MNDKDVKIIIKMIDETKEAVKSVKGGLTDVETATKKNNLSFKELAGASFVAQGAIKVLGGAFEIAKNIAGSLVNSVVDLGKELVGTAQQIQAYNDQIGALLGSHDKATQFAEDIEKIGSKIPGQTTDAIKEYGKEMLVAGYNANETANITKRLGDVTAVLGADKFPQLVEIFKNVEARGKLTSKELINLSKSGFDVQQAFGVNVNNLNEFGSEIQVNSAQLMESLERITNQGGKFFGATERWGSTAAGQIQEFNFRVDQLKDEIAIGLTPTLGMITGGMLDIWDTVETKVAPVLEKIGNNENFKTFLGYVDTAISQLTGTVGDLIANGLTSLLEGFNNILPSLNDFFNVLTGGKDPLEGVKKSLDGFSPVIEDVKKVWDNLNDTVKVLLSGIDWKQAKATFDSIKNTLKDLAEKGIKFVQEKMDDWYKNIIIPVTEYIKKEVAPEIKKLEPIFQDIASVVAWLASKIGDVLMPILNALYEAVKWVWETIGGIIKDVWEKHIKPTIDQFTYWYGVLKAALEDPKTQEAIGTIQTAMDNLGGTISTIFSPAAQNAKTDTDALAEGMQTTAPTDMGDNMNTLATDIQNTITTFTNLALGIADVIYQIDTFIKKVDAAKKAYDNASWLSKLTGFVGFEEIKAYNDYDAGLSPSEKYKNEQASKNQYQSIPQYAVGTNYVPVTGAALLHRGEAVIPASENPYTKKGGSSKLGVTININSPVYGVDNLKDIIINAVEEAQANQNRRGKYNLAF